MDIESGEKKYPFANMGVGDLIVIQGGAAEQERARVAASVYGKRYGKVLKTRKGVFSITVECVGTVTPKKSPVAPAKSAGRPLIYPFDRVKLGEPITIVVDPGKVASIRTALSQYAKRSGKLFATRIVAEGLKIYRIKPERRTNPIIPRRD